MHNQDDDKLQSGQQDETKTAPGGPVIMQVDPGMTVTVKSSSVTIAVIMDTGAHPPTGFSSNTAYYWLVSALPSNVTSLTVEIVNSQTPGSGSPTFSVSPPSSWTSGAPQNNASTFIDNVNGIAVRWDFTRSHGTWSGTATWFNTSQAPINQTGTFTLTNNTSPVSSIQYKAVDTAP